ncbi:LacI family DNA-binding transcriptional regulator [Paenibacillus sp. JDR-2]|uniref:LacI family DNA-binding transcriptional regulator n=1 Tax=Paenibacillus sp. (strain JDR-2) TaxID=324057 RepID=UPI000166BBE7|nr:LacI family DNA-binding transcriptional regulator [Paenibacillus sp. JDR-2]ACT01908.1 transcriptional regulator, LacI family [Paenibacillus sp. JDR-2]
MVKLKDIAERAGVSMMTVTHALRGTGRMSAETRLLIREIAEALHYLPNEVARGLRKKETRTIAFIVRHLSNPHFALMAEAVEDAAWRAGYRVYLCQSGDRPEREAEYVRTAISSKVDGIVMTPVQEKNNEHLHLLRKQGIPYVTIGHKPDPVQFPGDHVITDNRQKAAELAAHMLRQGHKRIVIADNRGNSVTSQRTEGFVEQLRQTGSFDERLLIPETSGRQLIEDILRQSKPYPTAMLLTHQFAAIEIIEELHRRGMQVPDHLSLACFDDFPMLARIQPLLTVMSQDSAGMGTRAVELLLKRIREGIPSDYEMIVVPAQLMVRQSCRLPIKELQSDKEAH